MATTSAIQSLNPNLITYRKREDNDVVQIEDTGSYLNLYWPSRTPGKVYGYIKYGIETEKGGKVCEFGYIQIQPAAKSIKLASLLVYQLSVKALNENAPVVRVIKPDPGLSDFWTQIGFDMEAARAAETSRLLGLYGDVPDETVVLQAEASSGRLMRINGGIANKLWDLGDAQLKIPKSSNCIMM